MTQAAKPAVRAKAKLSKKEQRQHAHARRRLVSRLGWGTVGIALLAPLGYGAWNLLRRLPRAGTRSRRTLTSTLTG
jgi:hypothetical protein